MVIQVPLMRVDNEELVLAVGSEERLSLLVATSMLLSLE